MQIGELIQCAKTELAGVGVPDCISDVHLLLGHCLGKSRTQLLACARDDVTKNQEEAFRTLLARRKKREPVAYILGEQEFWSLPFKVNRDVLIPRPETEFLLETVLTRTASGLPEGHVIDLCCGSGVIGAVLALELKKKVIAVDISGGALDVTKVNCARHGLGSRVSLVRSDLLSCFQPVGKVSLVVSNPPYVSRRAVEGELEPEVAAYEPALALDGGEEGMDLIFRIRRDLPGILKPGGHLFMEIGCDQGEAVRTLFCSHVEGMRDFSEVEILQDLAGRDRILHAVLRPGKKG